MKSCFLSLLILATFLLVSPIQALACACCAERGFYSISYNHMTVYERDEIKKLRFDSTANLYMDAAGEDGIKGITNIADSYDLVSKFLNPNVSLTFKTGANTGTLTLPLPAKMLRYKVDMHNTEGDGDPVLYKEWRFEGTTSGTGIFKGGIVAPTKYFLVLQGRGNVCDNASDFTHWRLEITGKKASYAFFGKLQAQ